MEAIPSQGLRVLQNDLIRNTIISFSGNLTLISLRGVSRYFKEVVSATLESATSPTIFVHLKSTNCSTNDPRTLPPCLVRSAVLDRSFEETSDPEYQVIIAQFFSKYQAILEELKVYNSSDENQAISFFEIWTSCSFPVLQTLEYTGDWGEVCTEDGTKKGSVINLKIFLRGWLYTVANHFVQRMIADCPNLKALQVQTAIHNALTYTQGLLHLEKLELKSLSAVTDWTGMFPEDFIGFPTLRKLTIISDSGDGRFILDSGGKVSFPRLDELDLSRCSEVVFLNSSAEFANLKALKTNGTDLLFTAFENLVGIETLNVRIDPKDDCERLGIFLKNCPNLKSLSILPKGLHSYNLPGIQKSLQLLMTLQNLPNLSDLEVWIFHPIRDLYDSGERQMPDECLKRLKIIAAKGLEKLRIVSLFESGIKGLDLIDVTNQYLYTLFPVLDKVRNTVIGGDAMFRRIKPFLQKELNQRRPRISVKLL